MTHASAFKLALAAAISTFACIAAAQQSGDMGAAGTSGEGAAGTSASTPAQGSGRSSGARTTDRASGYGSTSVELRDDRWRGACAGLSDRQTERACREDLRHRNETPNPSRWGNDAGNTDDQAN